MVNFGRIPLEKHHYKIIHSFFDSSIGDLILSNRASDYERKLREQMEKQYIVEWETPHHARIHSLLERALEKLPLKGKVIIFIDKENSLTAEAYPTTKEETDNFIVLSEKILNKLSDSELLFILGHEISHILFQHAVIKWITGTIYPELESMPPLIQNEWNIWIALAELSADRAGLKVCDSEDSGASALRKSLGMDDPVLDKRIACLFSDEAIDDYYNLILKRFTDDFYELYTDFFEKAVIYISKIDGHICSKEEEFILNRLSRHKYIHNGKIDTHRDINLNELIEEGKTVARLYPHKKKEIFLNLALLTLKDNKLTKEEYNILNTIGSEVFEFTPEKIDSLFISIIRSNFFSPYKEL